MAAALTALIGFAGVSASLPDWPVLAWGLLAYQRPIARQGGAAAVLAMWSDVLTGRPLGAGLGVVAFALFAANLLSSPNEKRWHGGHGLFTLIAMGSAWVGGGIFAAAGLGSLAIVPRPTTVLLSVAVVGCVAVGILARRLWIEYRSSAKSGAGWSPLAGSLR